MALTILGAGELGGRVAERAGGSPIAVTATDRRHPALRAAGVVPTTAWPTPVASDRWVLSLSGSAAQLAAVERLSESAVPARVVLVSTLGYHHPYTGRVGPDSPPGQGSRAAGAVRTEAAFRDWAGDHGVIVRLGGLWHATRGPLAAFARRGSAPEGAADAPLPLIHYDDAATLVLAALNATDPPPVLLGVTAWPTRERFYGEAARILGHPVPAFSGPSGAEVRFDDPIAARWLEEPEHPDWREPLRED